jgi:hypothetical protein
MSHVEALSGRSRLIWPALLSVGTVGGTLAAACMFPFGAFAAVAALTTDLRRGIGAVLAVWLANQIVGFGLMNYPTDAMTIAKGVAMLGATLVGFGLARAVSSSRFALLAAPVLAFAGYEVALWASAHLTGGVETFAPEIVALVARNDAVWFAGLMAARWLLTRTAPSLFGSRTTLQPA